MIIDVFHTPGELQPAPKWHVFPPSYLPSSATLAQKAWHHLSVRRNQPASQGQSLSFRRSLRRKQISSSQNEHSIAVCERCRFVSQEYGEDQASRRSDELQVSAYGLILVGASEEALPTRETAEMHDFCLFTFDLTDEIVDDSSLGIVVEDLLQSNRIFHTIRYPVSPDRHRIKRPEQDIIWNIPMPYRLFVTKELFDCRNWVSEFHGLAAEEFPSDGTKVDHWEHLQLLLYFLTRMSSYEVARIIAWAIASRDIPMFGGQHRSVFMKRAQRDEEQTRTAILLVRDAI